MRQGYPATYTLTVTPSGSFAGGVVLACAPLSTIQFASCSILPSSMTLANLSAQNSTLTINTVTAIQASLLRTATGGVLLCVLAPLCWLARGRRKLLPILMVALCALVPTGCGGGPNPNFRYTPPGTYQFQVTANSTSGTQITQTVTVTLVVTN